MKPTKRTAILLVLACGLTAPAPAQNLMLDEIVVRGQKEKLNQENLTMREVAESPARDIGEALAQVEGVSIVRKGAIANDVVLRGFQRDNINVLVDGARLHGACPNRMDSPAFHYDFAQVEKVEIIKGPYDLSNPGSMGGAVNAVSRRPAKGPGAGLNLTYGSYNSLNASAIGSYGGETLDALAGYAYKYSKAPKSGDGKRITEIYPATSPNRYKPEAVDSRAYEINTGWGKLGVNPTAESRAEFFYSYQDADHVLYPYLLMDAEYDRTSLFNASYSAGLSDGNGQTRVQVYWDRVDHLMDDRYRASSAPSGTVTREYSMRSIAVTATSGAKLQGALPVGGGTLRAGADFYRRNWDVVNRRAMASAYAPLNMIPDADIRNAGAFAEYERAVSETVTLKGGARGDFASAKAGTGNATAAAGTKKDYRELGADAQLSVRPSDNLEFFAGLARGARLPDQKELFLSIPNTGVTPTTNKNTFGNPGLRPTVNREADLGMKYSVEKFYANASVFYSDLHDYINLTGFQSAGPVRNITYENVEAVILGGEAGAQLSLPADLFARCSLSYARGRNVTGRRPLSEMPPLKGSASLRYDDGTLMFEAVEQLAARQSRVDSSLQEARTPGWAVTDLKAGFTRGDFSLYAGVNNLFDKFYYTHLSYLRDPFASGLKVPESGRNFYVTASARF
jgi:iron complex outermembrane receptor protein